MRPIIGLTLNYRDAERTSRCIASLLADGTAAVLVWDNSEDEGISAENLRQRWQAESRVVIQGEGHNLGFAAGVNCGIVAILQRWPESWIMLLNNDAIVQTGTLEALRCALENRPQAVIAYPQVNHNGRVIGTVFYQRHFALMSFDKRWPGSFPYPCGSALLAAPERGDLPLFDDDFFMYGEDVMLGWRLGSERMAHVPQVLVWHEGSASSKNGSMFYEFHTAAGHWRLAYKLARNQTDLMLLLIGRYLTLPTRAVLRSIRHRSFTPLKALFMSWVSVKGK